MSDVHSRDFLTWALFNLLIAHSRTAWFFADQVDDGCDRILYLRY
ncbi:MAG: hypothetical protein AAF329_14160 [Cyanobacteria bacterium P01_A01_bin.17]